MALSCRQEILPICLIPALTLEKIACYSPLVPRFTLYPGCSLLTPVRGVLVPRAGRFL
jgi:hypothetical protein